MPQVAATVTRAAGYSPRAAGYSLRATGYSPRRPAEHGPALKPDQTNMQSPLRGNGQVDRAQAEGREGGQPLHPPQGSPARLQGIEGGRPMQAPQGSPASLRGGSADPPPGCQGADGPAGGTCPHPQAVSSTAQSPPSQGSSRTSPGQGQQGTAGRQLGTGGDGKLAPAQVKSNVIWLHATRSFCHVHSIPKLGLQ